MRSCLFGLIDLGHQQAAGQEPVAFGTKHATETSSSRGNHHTKDSQVHNNESAIEMVYYLEADHDSGNQMEIKEHLPLLVDSGGMYKIMD